MDCLSKENLGIHWHETYKDAFIHLNENNQKRKSMNISVKNVTPHPRMQSIKEDIERATIVDVHTCDLCDPQKNHNNFSFFVICCNISSVSDWNYNTSTNEFRVV